MSRTPDQQDGMAPKDAGADSPRQRALNDRRKAALKANMARRKAQAKARTGAGVTAGTMSSSDPNNKKE